MALGIILPETDDTDQTAFATRAEALGYESVWLGELWGQNVFIELAEIADRTTHVRIGTSIVNVFSRSPAVLAMSAHSLDRLSEGRFVLGVGVSTPKAIEDLHGLAFEQPIRRTHEVVELVELFTGGMGQVNYEGKLFTVADFSALSVDVPIYNAALGPANRRVTGRLCDGWLPNNIPLSNLANAYDGIATAARNNGRDPGAIDVAPWIHTAVIDEPMRAKDAIRGTVAYYIGASDGYKNAVGAVYPDQATRIADAWRAGDHTEARSEVTNEMVDDLGCAGTVEEVRDGVKSLLENPLVDLPIISIPNNLDDEAIERTFEAVAPKNL